MNWEDSNNILKIGIIGAGFAAGVHSKALKSIDCSIRQYIFDVNGEVAKRFSDEYDCKVVKTLDDLFDSVDAVIIATPVWTHSDLVRKALNHNKHILCEKPMAQSCAEAKEMCNLAEITNVICAVGFNYRFFDITKSLQNEIVACKGNRFGICEGPITMHDKFFDSVDKLPTCIKEYKKTSPFYIKNLLNF